MRRSKYPNLGIMDAIERWLYGGIPKEVFEYSVIKSKILPNKSALSQKLYALKKGGLINYKNAKPVITERGYKYINFARLEELKIENKKRDGWWRVIIFDIPEEKRAARDLLRGKLNEFECYQLQKSVYVTWYACEKEIDELIKLLAIGEHICLIIARSLGVREPAVKKYFSQIHF